MSALPVNLDTIHPSLWRASELGHSTGHTLETGYPALSAELPGGGWPLGVLIDLLVQQPGVGEIRLLRPALGATGMQAIALLQPPHLPNAPAFAYLGIPLDKLLLLRAERSADALWSAEQILRAGSCGALVLWQKHIRAESLRRLHLAAQCSETLFLLVRPLAAAQDSSPAPLRLALRPAGDGIAVDIVKRRGPAREQPLSVLLQPTPILFSRHARVSRRPLTPLATRSAPAAVGA
ncbi:MAG: translesion DNA synthesis-associated protein ImuA [Janthinobacterium lividum]